MNAPKRSCFKGDEAALGEQRSIIIRRMKPSFTPREQQVIEQLLQGKSNKEIALVLGLSARAIEFHLSNLYAKLGVASRAEAILKLIDLRTSTGADLRTSTASELTQSGDNGGNPISQRRHSVKKLVPFLISIALALSAIAWALTYASTLPATEAAGSVSPSLPVSALSPVPSTVSSTAPSPVSSSAAQLLLEEIERLGAEYDQAVQAEKQSGLVEIVNDNVFFFKGQSYERIAELYEQFMERKTQIERDYTQILRAEIRPTPFPTPAEESARQPQYEHWAETGGDSLCSLRAWQNDSTARSFAVYDPDEGRYFPLYYGEVVARCEIFGQMLEEYRLAPWLERVDQERDLALIRQVMGNATLPLIFATIDPLANAPSYQAAIYEDETGNRYGIEISAGVLVSIEANYPSHPVIAESDRKSLDELRGAARQFALMLSPRLREMEQELYFEENCKGELCFFRWDFRNRDWSGTDWAFMPPLLQVGMLTNGQVATLTNTLDLFTP